MSSTPLSGRGRAHVPGHLTVFFSVHRQEEPRRSGSRGAGIAIEDGVTVTVRKGDGIELNGEPTEIEAVERVLTTFEPSLGVSIQTELPLGMGFGISGAAALGTALAANDVLDRSRTEEELVAIAHTADVESNTGLGDVVAQARGGLPIRLEPGVPPHGRLDGISATGRVEYLSLGTMSTQAVIGDDTSELSVAGDACLESLLEQPTTERLVSLGRTFATETDLMDDALQQIVDDVREAGGGACLGLLGRTVVSLDRGLSTAGYDPSVTAIDPTGATVVNQD